MIECFIENRIFYNRQAHSLPFLLITRKEVFYLEKDFKIVTPVYQHIAADLAAQIASGRYQLHDKVYARSTIASQYGVSAETARRAINVLADMDIVDTAKGSGVTIKSKENAIRFVKQFNDVKTVTDLKREIQEIIERQKQENALLQDRVSDLINRTDRFKSINPFVPFEILIASHTPYLNKTISEINFWHHTAATIIAIRRVDQLMMSPGPYAVLRAGDTVYFIGDEDCLERVRSYLYPA